VRLRGATPRGKRRTGVQPRREESRTGVQPRREEGALPGDAPPCVSTKTEECGWGNPRPYWEEESAESSNPLNQRF